MARYLPGQIAVLTSYFTDSEGVPANPDTVTLTVTKPSGAVVTPSTNSTVVGTWEATVELDEAGLWYYQFVGAGGGVDAIDQGTIVVREPRADLMTPTQLREHITTDLEDDALQRILDANEEAIRERAGPLGSITEYITVVGSDAQLFAGRPIGTVVELTEGAAILSANDYRIRSNGNWLERLDTGTNPGSQWGSEIILTYATPIDIAGRIRVLIQLCQLDITYKHGLTAQSIGSWSEQYASNSAYNYALQRENILSTLATPMVFA